MDSDRNRKYHSGVNDNSIRVIAKQGMLTGSQTKRENPPPGERW